MNTLLICLSLSKSRHKSSLFFRKILLLFTLCSVVWSKIIVSDLHSAVFISILNMLAHFGSYTDLVPPHIVFYVCPLFVAQCVCLDAGERRVHVVVDPNRFVRQEHHLAIDVQGVCTTELVGTFGRRYRDRCGIDIFT